MKKFEINSASAIFNIMGAIFYLIALIIPFTIQYYLQFLAFASILVTFIWYFSIVATIVLLIACVKAKKANIRIIGPLIGMIAHLLYFVFGIYSTVFSIALCILSAYYIFKFNTNVKINDIAN